jgi:hypothetical protein
MMARLSTSTAVVSGLGRRAYPCSVAQLSTLFTPLLLVLVCNPVAAQSSGFDVAAFDRARVLKAANQYLSEKPMTITAAKSPRSAGGLHHFFSEGDYWRPDPNNPGGPYIQRDGMTSPENFVEQRCYVMRLSVQVPALAAAWKLTKDPRYSKHVARHLRAWFIEAATRMNPNLQYARAIHVRVLSAHCLESGLIGHIRAGTGF